VNHVPNTLTKFLVTFITDYLLYDITFSLIYMIWRHFDFRR